METLRWSDILAKYLIYVALAAIVCAVLWYFSDVVIYILVAGVLSLISNPMTTRIKRLHIKNHYLPDWVAAIITIVIVLGIFASIITIIVPILGNLVRDISTLSSGVGIRSLAVPLQEFNDFLIERFPNLGNDFKIEALVLEQLQNILSLSTFSSVISSVTSFVAGTGVALFSIIFISFFFFKDGNLFNKIVAALVPDKSEKEALEAMSDIQTLLSRYFIGLLIEVCGVAILNFLGLMLVARLGFNTSISIAILTGLMNIVPYVGPLAGGALGVIIGVVMKYGVATPAGPDVSLWMFALILIAIFCVTQLIDNYLCQPIIYSNSIRVHPLEIFIVFLMAGHVGGILGMLVAVPCYTAIRVIAGRFFRKVKFIRCLIPEIPGATPPADSPSSADTVTPEDQEATPAADSTAGQSADSRTSDNGIAGDGTGDGAGAATETPAGDQP